MLIQKGGAVYILCNAHQTVLYVGVTSDLRNRIIEHKEKIYPKSFTAKYNCNVLVWYKIYSQIEEAISEEKRIKAGNRLKKIELINKLNPGWDNLWETDIKFW